MIDRLKESELKKESDGVMFQSISFRMKQGDDYIERETAECFARVAFNQEIKAFYMGIDYAFKLLGYEGILDFLPEHLQIEDKYRK